MRPPPPPLIELGLRALLPVLVAGACAVLVGVLATWAWSVRRGSQARDAAVRAFADAAARGAHHRAERAARRALGGNDRRRT